MTEYDLRYRETGGSWTDRPTTKNVAGRSASIDGLAADTDYEVQVLARNDEGESGWSPSDPGRTDGGGRSVYIGRRCGATKAKHAPVHHRFLACQVGRSSACWETHGASGPRHGLAQDFPRYWTDESHCNHVQVVVQLRSHGRASKVADFYADGVRHGDGATEEHPSDPTVHVRTT